MEKRRKRNIVLAIGSLIVIILAGVFGYFYYQKHYGWNAYDVVEIASGKFNEQQTFAYKKILTQKTKTPNGEVLGGGIREVYDVKIAKNQSFTVDYTDGQIDDDGKVKEIEKGKFYLTPDNKSYTDNLGYYFKVLELRADQYELPQYVNFIEDEFELAKNGNNKQVQEILETYEDGEYIITYKVRLNDMSTAVSEYGLHIDAKTNEFTKIIVKEHFEGYDVSKEYIIDQDYVAPDSITIPGDAEEIL